ncbi:MAG: type III pantothenate kinase [Bacteroidales bacterium]
MTAHRLVIDVGNTLTKVAVFQAQKQIALHTSEKIHIPDLENFRHSYQPAHAVLVSVGRLPEDTLEYLQSNYQLLMLDHHTPIPIRNLYKTPETLGKDRLAAVVAAADLFPGKNCLVIDAGTCITYDLIDRVAQYHGGAISPGIPLRFKALHTFTNKLPLVNHKNFDGLAGATTEESILAGVINGSLAEMEGTIGRYREKYPDLQVVLTGGDMNFFDKKLKSNIFAVPNLVLKGLNVILDFNVKNQ